MPGTVYRGAFLRFPHRLSGGYDFVGRGGGGILILLFASGQASQKGSDSSSEGGRVPGHEVDEVKWAASQPQVPRSQIGILHS